MIREKSKELISEDESTDAKNRADQLVVVKKFL
jgi:hypothetical protein